jgi:hypothetical protein
LSNTNPTTSPATVTFTPAANYFGPVTLTLTSDDPDGAGPCPPVTATRTITVNQAATANAGGPDVVCQSGTPSAITLSGASVGGGATTGAWSITSGGGSLSSTAQGPNPSTVTYTPATNFTGTVTLTLTTNDPAGPCPAVSATRTITVDLAATVNAGTTQTVCAGGTVTLAGTIGGSATSATWSAPSGTFSNPTSLTSTYTPSITSGTVTLTLTTNDPAGPCNAVTSTVVITVNQVATVNAGAAQTICAGGTVNLNGSVGGSATGGTWSGGTGGFNPNATKLDATYTPSAAEIAAGSVTLTLTTDDPPGPCPPAVSTVTITINRLQQPMRVLHNRCVQAELLLLQDLLEEAQRVEHGLLRVDHSRILIY